MSLLSRDELRALIEHGAGPCISLFTPTHRAGGETQQDPIRFKNLLKGAEDRLAASGLRPAEVRALLEPARALLADALFWQHQRDGLAVFIARGWFRHYRLPLALPELVVVGERFHVKPLLALYTGDGPFHILALSQNQVRLFAGTRHRVEEVALQGVPTSLAEALQLDEPGRQLQFHTRTPAGKGERAAIFHGHGDEEAKDHLLRYFRLVDRGLADLLRGEPAPLVLAAVEYLMPIYREANTFPHLAPEGIPGNPEGLAAEELHRRAWAIVEPRWRAAEREAAARYRQLRGTGKTVNDVEGAVVAASQGRVDTLFVAVGRQVWGRFDPETATVRTREAPEPGDEDLLDLAAVHTLVHGGTVYPVEPGAGPDDAPLAAILRY